MRTLKLLSVLLLSIPLFYGCANNQELGNDDNDNRNLLGRNVRYDTNGDDRERNNVFDDNEPLNVRDDNFRDNNSDRLDVADEAANRITKIKEVDRANVIVTNRNAYVAVVLKGDTEGKLTRDVENQIAKTVRATDDDIRNVFVSSNPDFVDRMTDYGDKIERGEPIEGLVEEFNETVRRVFPNAR
ncbi:YhcN/YlaJ family sporulation lipoprotein [Oikeobacillus pervagus]|uniref:YhcN/YlaJ family sporulation lipoprotein n=1 Tax=Oikeobacillus pervagus TaxID=1325931 RepID=A0AAJ1SWL3_9BACI|nr:YhcN/YlaJ family sporulation lipoprotein [Oikeobacillus pervagus]MDQ0213959.1 YhcN/YlaJ family sporulation lipoprotein [Oikeobacillus pervagus]